MISRDLQSAPQNLISLTGLNDLSGFCCGILIFFIPDRFNKPVRKNSINLRPILQVMIE